MMFSDTPNLRLVVNAMGLVIPGFKDPLACQQCWGWRELCDNRSLCSSCQVSVGSLGIPPPPVAPITLYAKPSAMRDALTNYKRIGEDFQQRSHDLLASLLARFWAQCSLAIRQQFGEWDSICTIPSTQETPRASGIASLAESARIAAADTTDWVRWTGSRIDPQQSNPDAFVSNAAQLLGRRFLLLDDVFTSGAHLYSASHTLTARGGVVVGCVVIARRINPHFNQYAQTYWDGRIGETPSWENWCNGFTTKG